MEKHCCPLGQWPEHPEIRCFLVGMVIPAGKAKCIERHRDIRRSKRYIGSAGTHWIHSYDRPVSEITTDLIVQREELAIAVCGSERRITVVKRDL